MKLYRERSVKSLPLKAKSIHVAGISYIVPRGGFYSLYFWQGETVFKVCQAFKTRLEAYFYAHIRNGV